MSTTNSERVLEFLWLIRPEGATGVQIRTATRLEPHKQVAQILRHLEQIGALYASGPERDAVYYARVSADAIRPPVVIPSGLRAGRMNAVQFEDLARRAFSARYGVALEPRRLPGVPASLALVSADGCLAGDVKFSALGSREHISNAQSTAISECAWLLEKSGARIQFIVFGNDKRVPRQWLEKFGGLVSNLSMFFLTADGGIEVLY